MGKLTQQETLVTSPVRVGLIMKLSKKIHYCSHTPTHMHPHAHIHTHTHTHTHTPMMTVFYRLL